MTTATTTTTTTKPTVPRTGLGRSLETPRGGRVAWASSGAALCAGSWSGASSSCRRGSARKSSTRSTSSTRRCALSAPPKKKAKRKRRDGTKKRLDKTTRAEQDLHDRAFGSVPFKRARAPRKHFARNHRIQEGQQRQEQKKTRIGTQPRESEQSCVLF